MTDKRLLYGGGTGLLSQAAGSMEQLDAGFLNGADGDTAVLNVSTHNLYLLMTGEVTRSSGAVRGYRAIQVFNTGTTFARQNLAASTNSGVTLTNDTTNRTITVTPSSTSYDVYYALYAVL